MTPTATLATQSAALVRRARAGDENAMGLIARVGEEARRGKNKRAQAAFVAIKRYIDTHPSKPFQLGTETALVMDPPPDSPAPTKIAVEKRKAPLPRGSLDRLFDADSFALVIIRACQYRNGLEGAAVVLASGPPLTQSLIHHLGVSNFGSRESTGTFFHGVKHPEVAVWEEVAPHLDPPMRRCLALGQCVGRARKIQMVRQKRSQIGAYSEVAGWELGE